MKVIRNPQNEVIAEVTAQGNLVQAVSLALATISDAVLFQLVIDAELKSSKSRRVLVDARRALRSSTEINESMWSWVSGSANFDRLAIVNQSMVLSVAAGMKATAIGTKKVKVFDDFQAAVRWLLAR
jgi:hypothetical protein